MKKLLPGNDVLRRLFGQYKDPNTVKPRLDNFLVYENAKKLPDVERVTERLIVD